ncbi:MAG: hypothetical protein WCQ69_08645 [Bacteroidales bacterium]|jgi:anti-sigma-K factor RskA|nr:hypothetical protein [Bacteroidales bacterium]MDD2264540.1 hypothetical protein [Bacteroidales bacterium]MDD2831775.1 hypothetical protein [Bacteroidales bacterium]MDD3209419.1 hypothetical protein [Bacteroidales bacterium]MDD3697775.1 hypothetical protein [Bacteroidales bacterium]
MKTDKIKKIMDKHYEGIEVPSGLEAKISATIDRLAAAETANDQEQEKPRRIKLVQKHPHWRIVAVAASVTIVITLAIFLPVKENRVQLADTFTNVDDAYQETEKVLEYVSSLMNKGVAKVSETQESIRSIKTINKYLEIKEQ